MCLGSRKKYHIHEKSSVSLKKEAAAMVQGHSTRDVAGAAERPHQGIVAATVSGFRSILPATTTAFPGLLFYGAYFDFCAAMQVRLYGVKMKTQGKPAGIKKARRGGGPFLFG